MNREDQCPECSGGGLVPAQGCTCDGTTHTCMPAICTMCDGTGQRKLESWRINSGS